MCTFCQVFAAAFLMSFEKDVKRQVGELSIRMKGMSPSLCLERRSENLPELDAIAQTTN